MKKASYKIKVWGEYACFSRPEFKVERVSYPVITPSAARGVLEAIFWKPEFRWEIKQVDVLSPIKTISLIRNEIADRQGGQKETYTVEAHRQQRTSLLLRDVSYVIHADLVLRSHAKAPLAKYQSQFERRLKKGQYHHTPYLGTREFPAFFAEATEEDTPLAVDHEIGTMLLDMDFQVDKKGEMTFYTHGAERKKVKGNAQPRFFNARLENGVLRVPGGG